LNTVAAQDPSEPLERNKKRVVIHLTKKPSWIGSGRKLLP
jgi:hypothetical protein